MANDDREPTPDEIRAAEKLEAELGPAQTPLENRDIPRVAPDPLAQDPGNIQMEPGVAKIDDRGATGGAGLPEVATEAELEMEAGAGQEADLLPSDMRDVGDPEGGDVGVPGGLAAGGEMGEGGRGHDPQTGDAWGSDLQPPVENRAPGERTNPEENTLEDIGGTGDLMNAAEGEDQLMEDRGRREREGG